MLLFATAREAVGAPRLRRTVAPLGAPLEEFLQAIETEFPRLASIRQHSRIVVNGQYTSARSVRIHPGDEVAIHPPYSGG